MSGASPVLFWQIALNSQPPSSSRPSTLCCFPIDDFEGFHSKDWSIILDTMSYSETALRLLKYLPRISLGNLVRHPYIKKTKYQRGQYARSGRKNYGQKGMLQHQKFLPPGYDAHSTPFHLRVPVENYYKDILHKRQHPPLSLHRLQLMIDTNVLDPSEPIDLCSLCQTNQYKIDAFDNHYGVHLTDEGVDLFKAKVNIEVQYASEQVIAAVERNGGVIRTAFYDIVSVLCLADPEAFFKKGQPIPRRGLPPPDVLEYYTSAKNRGYLADPREIEKERLLLAQKYGYSLADIESDPIKHILLAKKDPRQVFFGLQPGWIVNLRDQTVYQPTSDALQKYYSS